MKRNYLSHWQRNEKKLMRPLKAYACYNTDKDVRLASSSGAVFSSLAEYVLERDGVVYGVAMSEDAYSAEFISVMNKEELARLRGSKYLQAKVGNAYKLAKKDLMLGKLVLFTGTGCQINGFKNFLGKNYENLICVDVIATRKLKRLYISKNSDSYMQMFLRDYCLRPSCYECIAKKMKTMDYFFCSSVRRNRSERDTHIVQK